MTPLLPPLFAPFRKSSNVLIRCLFVGLPTFALHSLNAEVNLDGNFDDWPSLFSGGSSALVEVADGSDLPDVSGDIRGISAQVEGSELVLTMTVGGVFGPSVEETPEGKTNRYYYHWIIDTDNNAATGVSNASYENIPTNLETPIGSDLVVQFGWRDGATNGVFAYLSRDGDENPLITDYEWSKEGDTLTARLPLESLELIGGQTIAISAFQEGASDDWMTDWMESVVLQIPSVPAPVSVDDGSDLPDVSGDIRNITAGVEGTELVLTMTVGGVFAPSVEETPEGKTNRYYYHWIIDTDNNAATGVSNASYENIPTNLETPIGSDLVVQFGWRDGATNGVFAYLSRDGDENPLITDYEWSKEGDTITARLPLEVLEIIGGQTIAVSAFQEGASDDWMTDWMESAVLKIPAQPNIVGVEDPADMADSSGDITWVQATTDGTYLYLGMSVAGTAAPTVEETPEGMTNRYYYHWLIDADNNPATGVSNATYENVSTGLTNPMGSEVVVQFGWRDGAPNGVYAYNPNNEDEEALIEDYEWGNGGDSLEVRVPLEALGLNVGQQVRVSAFQEGASDDWSVDWMESVELVLSLPSDTSGPNLAETIEANAYNYHIVLEDGQGIEIDPETLEFYIDEVPVEAEVTKEGTTTTVSGSFAEWLPSESLHRIRIVYGAGVTDVPFEVPAYKVIPGLYGQSTLEGVPAGFVANISQVSGFQAPAESAHQNDTTLGDLQVRGELFSADGKPYYNEASETENGWEEVIHEWDGILNWAEDPQIFAGNFNQQLTGQPDDTIPFIPGSKGSTDGLAIEVLAYLELDAGFHSFGVNTVGGFRATMGPDGNDQLSPIVGVYNGSSRYSFLGDHYFSILAPEPGFYPIRLIFTHHSRTEEGASMEFFSLKGTKKIPINDPDDPNAVKAYQLTSGAGTYVSRVSPAPESDTVAANQPLVFQLTQGTPGIVAGSIVLKLDGITVSPTITNSGNITEVRYHPGMLEVGSRHEVEFSYTLAGDPPISRMETYEFGVFSAALRLAPEWAAPADSGSEPGFTLRSVQSTSLAGTLAAAEELLGGQGSFTGSASLSSINLGSGGILGDDTSFVDAGLTQDGNPNFFSIEALTYLHLTPGVYTFGVNSDDGFRWSAGESHTNLSQTLIQFDGGRGALADAPQDLIDVVAPVEGLYAFRLLYFQGEGDASVELYQYDRASGTATLVNTPGAVSAYQERSEEPTAIEGPRLALASTTDLGSIAVTDLMLNSGLLIFNLGTTNALTVSDATFSGGDAAHFAVTELPEPIAPGESGLVRIAFQPNGRTGGFVSNLAIQSDDPDQATFSVAISAGAIDPLGPVAHYAMDETEGTALIDSSGYQRNGEYLTAAGSITLGEPPLATGTSVAFNGGSHAVISGQSFERWESFSVSAWVESASSAAPQMIFAKGNTVDSNPAFALLTVGGSLQWFLGEQSQLETDAGVLTAGEPHHVVVSYSTGGDGETLTIYLDGEEIAMLEDAPFVSTGSADSLYLASFRGAVPFGGLIDDVQIYSRSLNAEEVAFLHTTPGAVLATPTDPGGDYDIPIIANTALGNGGALGFEFPTEAGATYEIQYSQTLATASWTTIQTIPGTGSSASFSETDATRLGHLIGFYRVLVK